MQSTDDDQRFAEHAVVHREPPLEQGKLRFLQWEEWDRQCSYDEIPPTCMRYSIECSVVVKKRRDKSIIIRDTEPNVVLAPSVFWTRVLLPKLSKLLKRKFVTGTQPKPDDCLIVASVTDRSDDNRSRASLHSAPRPHNESSSLTSPSFPRLFLCCASTLPPRSYTIAVWPGHLYRSQGVLSDPAEQSALAE